MRSKRSTCMPMLRGLLATTLSITALLLPPQSATAAPADGCSTVVANTDDSGVGSLRDAVACAPTGATITFAPATFNVPRTITLTSAEIPITNTKIISGPGSNLLTISGNNARRHFNVSGGDVRFYGMTLSSGRAVDGGAIYEVGATSLTISDTRIVSNSATSNGGGLFSLSPLTIVGSRIMSNTAGTYSGGFYATAVVTMTNSQVLSNTAGADYGGFYADAVVTMSNSQVLSNTAFNDTGGFSARGALTMIDSQVSYNTADNNFGGVDAISTAVITNSTIAANTASKQSGGIYARSFITIVNSTIVDNAAGYSGGGLTVISTSRLVNVSIISNSASSGAGIFFDNSSGTHDFINTIIGGVAVHLCSAAPTFPTVHDVNSISDNTDCPVRTVPSIGVGPLGNHGGSQPTAPLVAGSPALDAGDPTACPATDQRGLSRVGTCDIGAYESRGFRMTIQDGTDQYAMPFWAFASPISAQFFSDHGEPVGPGGILYVTGPSTGATLSPSATYGLIDASGWVSLSFNAGSLYGTYAVTITAAGIATPVVGNMSNICSTVVANTNDSGAGSLRNAIACAPAGATITFAPAKFNIPQTITLTSDEIPITNTKTISGPGSSLLTISGNNTRRQFSVSGGDVRLYGMTLSSGRADSGGAVYASGAASLIISNTRIVSNSATSDGGGLFSWSPLTIVGSTIMSNTAGSNYGGFSAYGILTMTNSQVSYNTAAVSYGGFAAGAVTMTSSQVLSNTAGANFGGFHINDSLKMVDSQVLSNTAGASYGGFFAGGALMMTNSQVLSNTAGTSYGGFYAGGTLTMVNSQVLSNTVGNDCGGFFAGGALIMIDSQVSHNSADNSNGGFWAASAATLVNAQVSYNIAGYASGGFFASDALTMTNSQVSYNIAGAYYGGFYAQDTTTLVDSQVSYNSAGNSGGGFYATGPLMISSSQVSHNTAGGDDGGFTASSAVTLVDSQVLSNTAGASRGGFAATGPLTISRSQVSHNVAVTDVGGFSAGDTTTLIDSRISYNSAGSSRGGFYAFGALKMTNSQVSHNIAGSEDGGFYAYNAATLLDSQVLSNTAGASRGGFAAIGAFTMTNSQVSYNSAGDSGGGFIAYSPITLVDSQVSYNSAGDSGGGFTAYSPVTLVDSQVLSNTAGDSSGGFTAYAPISLVNAEVSYNTAVTSAGGIDAISTAVITNSTIAENVAGVYGGGIFAFSSITIVNSTIAENVAGVYGGGLSVFFTSAARLVNVSIVSNSAPAGAGIYFENNSGVHNFINTIIGGATADQCAATWPYPAVRNVDSISNDAACGMRTVPSVGVGRLGNYGGSHPTAPLVAGSPALDAGDPTACPALDQRGLSRVGTCDIGAYESRGFRMTVQGGTGQSAALLSAFASPISARFFSDHSEPLGPGGVLYVAGPPTGATLSPSATHGLINASGWVSLSLIAGSSLGTYPITITAAGILTPVVGSMTNFASAPTSRSWFPFAMRK